MSSSPEMDRRGFLKYLGASAAALTFSGCQNEWVWRWDNNGFYNTETGDYVEKEQVFIEKNIQIDTEPSGAKMFFNVQHGIDPNYDVNSWYYKRGPLDFKLKVYKDFTPTDSKVKGGGKYSKEITTGRYKFSLGSINGEKTFRFYYPNIDHMCHTLYNNISFGLRNNPMKEQELMLFVFKAEMPGYEDEYFSFSGIPDSKTIKLRPEETETD